jgi:hypothetical protein
MIMIRKEVVVTYFRQIYYPTICFKGLSKTTRNLSIAGIWAKIRTVGLPNKNSCANYLVVISGMFYDLSYVAEFVQEDWERG